jgi:hypothetical protein
MRPHKSLLKLQKVAIKRLNYFEQLLSTVGSNNSFEQNETTLAYITIELLNTWVNFSRSFYLSCTIFPKTVSGNRITTTMLLNSFNDAIGVAISQTNRRRSPNNQGIWHRKDEPTWHDPNVIIKICRYIGCSNIAEIESALSGGQTVFTNLPTFRNFFAHRNQQTELAAKTVALQKYGISAPQLKISQILLLLPLSETQPLIIIWIVEMKITIELLCYE